MNFQIDNLSLGCSPPLRCTYIDTADAIVVMYSVTDRNSFHVARETLDWLAFEFDNKSNEGLYFPATLGFNQLELWHPPITCPVLLLGNKTDLSTARQVCD